MPRDPRRHGCCACEHAPKGTPRGTVPQPEIPLPCNLTPGTCPHGLDAALAIDDKQTPIFDEVSEEDGSWRTEDAGAWHESSEDYADRQNTAASIAPYLAVLPHLAGVLSDKQREVVNALLDARKQADLARSIDVRRQTTGVHLKRAKGRLAGILFTLHHEAAASAVGQTTLEDGLVSLARIANTMTAHQALVMLELVAGNHTSWGQLAKVFGGSKAAVFLLVPIVVDRMEAVVDRASAPSQHRPGIPSKLLTEGSVLAELRHPTSATDLPIAIRRTLATQLAGIYVSRCRVEDTNPDPKAVYAGVRIFRLIHANVALAAANSLAMIDEALPPARSRA